MGSRSNSAQVLPKKKSAASPLSQAKPQPAPPRIYTSPPTPYTNGSIKSSPLSQPGVAKSPTPPSQTPPSSSSASKVSKKKKRKATDKSKTNADTPARSSSLPYILLLFAFYAYTALVCPADDLVCKGVGAWQLHVLEPYVMPHIRSARSDPRVRYVENQVLIPAYDHAVIPIYKNAVEPFYKETLAPFYDSTLHPHIRPYTKKAHVYWLRTRTAAQPYVKQMWAYYDTVLPYVDAAWAKVKITYDYVKPHIIDAYRTVLPYAEESYRFLAVALSEARLKAVELRQVYVDPHVQKIWDKIIEGQSADANARL